MLLSIITNLLVTAAPKPTTRPTTTPTPTPTGGGNSTKNDGYVLDPNRSYDGLDRISIPGVIAGVFMFFTGLYLCLVATLFTRFKKGAIFLIGFYFYGNITYLIMVNAGVTSEWGIFVGTILVGTLLGVFRLFYFRRPGAELLGPIALHCLGLWLLCIRPGGLIPNRLHQIALLVVLNVVGFAFIFMKTDHISASAGFSVLGAFVAVAGADFIARTGFVQQADAFVNSKSDFNSADNILFRKHIPLAAFFVPIGLVAGFAFLGLWLQLTKGRPKEDRTPFSYDKEREQALSYEDPIQTFLRGIRGLFCFGADSPGDCCPPRRSGGAEQQPYQLPKV